MTRQRLVDADRFIATLDADRVELAPGKACRGTIERALGSHDRGTEIFVGALKPRGDVHGVAHHRVIEALTRTNIADQGVAGIQPDPLAQAETLPFGRIAVELVETLAAVQGGVDRIRCMIRIVERRTEYRDNRIADIFVDETAMLLDDVGHCR